MICFRKHFTYTKLFYATFTYTTFKLPSILKCGGKKTRSATSILACYSLHKQDSERSYE